MISLGVLLVILGVGSLVLPAFDFQFRLMEIVDPYQPWAGVIVAAVGLITILFGAQRRGRKAAEPAQATATAAAPAAPAAAAAPPAAPPPAAEPPAAQDAPASTTWPETAAAPPAAGTGPPAAPEPVSKPWPTDPPERHDD